MNLLTFLAMKGRLDYLSDLRLTPRCKQFISEVENITFPLKDWNEAIHYLCKTELSFDDIESAKDYLLNF